MKRTSLLLALTVLVGALFSLSVTTARAQSASSGGITGQVSDPQGAIVRALM